MTRTRKLWIGGTILRSLMTFIFAETRRIWSAGGSTLLPSYVFTAPELICDFVQFSLLTSQEQRLPVEHIKAHPFFYGVDWDTIRHIDAPFVPHLRSITDTSYFPTEELENVPDTPAGADTSGANKDLAFLGQVHSHTAV
jgi:hypothetical protein